jgi:hypothetical protein
MEIRVGSIRLSDVFLAALVLFYSLNFGPMVFESLTSDRLWASNPPDSFYMFLGGTARRPPTTGGSCHPSRL